MENFGTDIAVELFGNLGGNEIIVVAIVLCSLLGSLPLSFCFRGAVLAQNCSPLSYAPFHALSPNAHAHIN